MGRKKESPAFSGFKINGDGLNLTSVISPQKQTTILNGESATIIIVIWTRESKRYQIIVTEGLSDQPSMMTRTKKNVNDSILARLAPFYWSQFEHDLQDNLLLFSSLLCLHRRSLYSAAMSSTQPFILPSKHRRRTKTAGWSLDIWLVIKTALCALFI